MSERLPLASVAVAAGAALANEILLTRFFAVVHWHHFAYMMISLALLGFGASGTFLVYARRRLLDRFAPAYVANLLLFAACAVIGPAIALRLPFRAEELLWNPVQPVWLAAIYLVLALPFFCVANAIGLALLARRAEVGRVYAADLVGAGLGSLSILLLLYVVAPEHALKVLAAAGCVAALVARIELGLRTRVGLAAGALGLALIVAIPDDWLRPEPGPYKGLSQALRVEGTRIIAERTSPLGRVDVIESPRVPLRHAPGLSLAATGEPPPQLGLFTDGDAMDVITESSTDPGRLAFLDATTAAVGYHVAKPRSVLVLGAGGGLEVLRARQLGAQRIDAIELNAQVAQLLGDDFAAYSGNLVAQPGVELQVGDARGFLGAHRRRYDLIQMSLVAAGGGGLGGLNEDYLHTVEAFRLYLAHLVPDGVLSISRYVQVPPRDGLKLFATARAALEAAGVPDPGRRLLMIRSWQTVTLLVKNGDVSASDVAGMRRFCDERWFDVAWYPGMPRSEANRYNELAEPWFHDGARAVLGADHEHFIAHYAFDIRPASDDRPYFQNFFRWPSFAEAWRTRGRGGMALLEAGYPVLAATAVQALTAGILLIVVPLLWLRQHAVAKPDRRRVLAYFACIGLAFLFIEIVFLQKMLRVVHQPTVALAIVLATFLVGAGAGSHHAGRTAPGTLSRRRLAVSVAGIVALGALESFAFDPLLASLAQWPIAARAGIAVLMLAPLAFLMGAPFPLALREVDAPLAPWAWGINGCASVLAPALATLLAIDLGHTAVLWLALALYVITLLVYPGASSTARGAA